MGNEECCQTQDHSGPITDSLKINVEKKYGEENSHSPSKKSDHFSFFYGNSSMNQSGLKGQLLGPSQRLKDLINTLKPFHDKISNEPVRRLGSNFYEGTLDENNVPNGFGRLYSNTSVLVGLFNHGVLNGKAFYILDNGSYFKGNIVNNEANDEAGEYHSQDMTYIGSFKDSKFHGHGKETGKFHNFEGQYFKGIKVSGILTWTDQLQKPVTQQPVDIKSYSITVSNTNNSFSPRSTNTQALNNTHLTDSGLNAIQQYKVHRNTTNQENNNHHVDSHQVNNQLNQAQAIVNQPINIEGKTSNLESLSSRISTNPGSNNDSKKHQAQQNFVSGLTQSQMSPRTSQQVSSEKKYRYQGGFDVKGQFSGEGKLEEPAGVYQGTFKNGLKHGKGVYWYANGLRYQGNYFDGIKHGKGIIFQKNGTIGYEGLFQNGQPVSGKPIANQQTENQQNKTMHVLADSTLINSSRQTQEVEFQRGYKTKNHKIVAAAERANSEMSPLMGVILSQGLEDKGLKGKGKGIWECSDLWDNVIVKSFQSEIQRSEMLHRAKAQKGSKQHFSDRNFPSNIGSLSKSSMNYPQFHALCTYNKYGFQHYKNLFPNAQLIEGEVTPHDILQGELGDCYFLSAMASMSEYKQIVQRLFEYADIESGYFLVWLCIGGSWKLWELDGYIPIKHQSDGKPTPAFSSAHNQELWVLLLEKAYAKAHGSYSNIIGGISCEAISDLTGSPYTIFKHDNPSHRNALWDSLVKANSLSQLMAGSSRRAKAGNNLTKETNEIGLHGIVSQHEYTILDLAEVGGERIVKLRNPWGEIEWNGDWSDKSTKWTPERRAKLNYYESTEDGVFWMPYLAYLQNYDQTSINYFHPRYHYYSTQLRCEGDGNSQYKVYTLSRSLKKGYAFLNRYDQNLEASKVIREWLKIEGYALTEKGKVKRKLENLSKPDDNSSYRVTGFAFEYGTHGTIEEETLVILVRILPNAQQSFALCCYFQGNGQKVSPNEVFIEQPNKFEHLTKIFADGHEEIADEISTTPFFKAGSFSIDEESAMCFFNHTQKSCDLVVSFNQMVNLRITDPQGPTFNLRLNPGQTQLIRAHRIQPGKLSSFGGFSINSNLPSYR